MSDVSHIDPDVQAALIAKGVEIGRQHSQSSPETEKRLEQLEDTLKEHSEEHRMLNEKLEKLQETLDKAMPAINAYEEAQNDLKTAKKVGGLAWMSAIAVTTFGGAYLVIKQIHG